MANGCVAINSAKRAMQCEHATLQYTLSALRTMTARRTGNYKRKRKKNLRKKNARAQYTIAGAVSSDLNWPSFCLRLTCRPRNKERNTEFHFSFICALIRFYGLSTCRSCANAVPQCRVIRVIFGWPWLPRYSNFVSFRRNQQNRRQVKCTVAVAGGTCIRLCSICMRCSGCSGIRIYFLRDCTRYTERAISLARGNIQVPNVAISRFPCFKRAKLTWENNSCSAYSLTSAWIIRV